MKEERTVKPSHEQTDASRAQTAPAGPAPGEVYQEVAQDAAIAIQDAADNLRNMNTIADTALGTAMAQSIDSNTRESGKETLAEAREINNATD